MGVVVIIFVAVALCVVALNFIALDMVAVVLRTNRHADIDDVFQATDRQLISRGPGGCQSHESVRGESERPQRARLQGFFIYQTLHRRRDSLASGGVLEDLRISLERLGRCWSYA